MSELDEKGVSNNSFFRGISNALDCIPGFKDSSLRANIHGMYHDHVANQKKSMVTMKVQKLKEKELKNNMIKPEEVLQVQIQIK